MKVKLQNAYKKYNALFKGNNFLIIQTQINKFLLKIDTTKLFYTP